MVIQCPECQTRFQLADEKVKPGGIKVRCAKCKQIFPVMPPPLAPEEELAPAAATMPQDEQHSVPPADTGPKDEESGQEDASEFFFGTQGSQPPESQNQKAAASDLDVQPDTNLPETSASEDAPKGASDFSFADTFAQAPPAEAGTEATPLEDAFGFADAFSEETTASDRSAEPSSEEDGFTFEEPFAEKVAETGIGAEPAPEEDTFGLSDAFGEETGAAEAEQEQDALAFDSVFSEEPAAGMELGAEPGPEPEGIAFDDEFAVQPDQPEPDQAGNEDDFSFERDFRSDGDNLSQGETAAAEGSDEFSFTEGEGQQDEEFSFEEDISFDTPAEAPAQENETFASDEFSFDEESDETSLSWETEASGAAVDELDFADQASAGDEDDFDFSNMTFGEEDAGASAQVEAGDFASQTAEEFPAPEVAAAPLASPPAAPTAEVEQAEEAREPAPAAEPKAKRKGPLSGLTLFLLVLLLALLGAAGYFFWSGKSLDINQLIGRLTGKQAGSAAAGQIRLSGLTSVFITNKQAGQLFVIQGQAINDFPEPRSAVTVKGILFDKDGKQLMQQTVFCGNTLEEEALKNWPFSKIEESMNNQFGDSLSNLNIAPGKAVPFSIVFKNLPPNLAEFIVEPADSKPGSKQ